MTTTTPPTSDTPNTTPPVPSFAEIRAALQTLPEIQTTLTPQEFLSVADSMSKAGKLPGFEKTPSYFSTLLFGAPFDRVMTSTATTRSDHTRIKFSTKLLLKMPLIFAALIIFSIWPGVTLTHSLLRTYFPAYTIETWWWYIPLTVLPLPWYLKKTIKQSEASCLLSAIENINLLAERAKGEVIETK